MRVFPDTNVLVSAFTTRGLCADVLRTILAEHDLVTGEYVLNELKRVLIERFGIPEKHVISIISFLRRFHVEPAPQDTPDLQICDSDNLFVLASALSAKIDVLVTGDRDLLEVNDQVDIRITDPRGFWSMLKK